MNRVKDPEFGFTNQNIYMVGIKGTGMTTLAELLQAKKNSVTGSDVTETFYTDTILQSLHIPYFEGFAAENLPSGIDLVIYSAAYDPCEHVELKAAAERQIPVMKYTEVLGLLSENSLSVAVAGMHGKTSTTAILGGLAKDFDLNASVVVGSGVRAFGNRGAWFGGERILIAETCEYRRHFLSYKPNIILLTSVEADHMDYFKDLKDIDSAFTEFIMTLPLEGWLVYCCDDEGACRVVSRIQQSRPDIRVVPYGFSSAGFGEIRRQWIDNGWNCFQTADNEAVFRIPIPGRHYIQNAAGALCVLNILLKSTITSWTAEDIPLLQESLRMFAGCTRRSEILGEAGGVIYVDDYGHHPTAVGKTLNGYRHFYPDRRILVNFMPHLYSRTADLLVEFSRSFSDADLVILNRIYSSAREKTGRITGLDLFRQTAGEHPLVFYAHTVDDTVGLCRKLITPGDVFVTMGAGDNWKVGKILFESAVKTGGLH